MAVRVQQPLIRRRWKHLIPLSAFVRLATEINWLRKLSERRLLRSRALAGGVYDPTLRKTLRWTAIVVGSLVVIPYWRLALLDWNSFKHPIERVASAKSGRAVTIGGDLNVHIWSWTPTVTVNGLTVGNPPWESESPDGEDRPVGSAPEAATAFEGRCNPAAGGIAATRSVFAPGEQGRANWTFENKAPTNAPASKPTKLPVVRDLLIEDGKLTVADEMRRLKVDGTIQAHEQKSQADPTPFRIQGKGTINDQPFD